MRVPISRLGGHRYDGLTLSSHMLNEPTFLMQPTVDEVFEEKLDVILGRPKEAERKGKGTAQAIPRKDEQPRRSKPRTLVVSQAGGRER